MLCNVLVCFSLHLKTLLRCIRCARSPIHSLQSIYKFITCKKLKIIFGRVCVCVDTQSVDRVRARDREKERTSNRANKQTREYQISNTKGLWVVRFRIEIPSVYSTCMLQSFQCRKFWIYCFTGALFCHCNYFQSKMKGVRHEPRERACLQRFVHFTLFFFFNFFL